MFGFQNQHVFFLGFFPILTGFTGFIQSRLGDLRWLESAAVHFPPEGWILKCEFFFFFFFFLILFF